MLKNHLITAYILMVGAPLLALLGILEAGRGISAPMAIGGDWTVEFASAGGCAASSANLRQPALTISQSGTQAQITWNNARANTLNAAVDGATLSAPSLAATIGGKPGARTLAGRVQFDGCGPVAFQAVRRITGKSD